MIPRAKITCITRGPIRGMFESQPNCGCFQLNFAAESINLASDLTRGHFWEVHGVRTVGSLTADDIGKWIETDFAEGKLRYVTHEIDALGDACSLVEVGLEPEVFVSSSTVCRVTEAKP